MKNGAIALLFGVLLVLLGSCGQDSADKQAGGFNPDGSPITLGQDGSGDGDASKATTGQDGSSGDASGEDSAKTNDLDTTKPGEQGPSPEELEAARLKKLVLDAPRIDPEAALSKTAVTVALSVISTESKIYYTLDGSNPGPSKGTLYKGPFTLSASTQLPTRSCFCR